MQGIMHPLYVIRTFAQCAIDIKTQVSVRGGMRMPVGAPPPPTPPALIAPVIYPENPSAFGGNHTMSLGVLTLCGITLESSLSMLDLACRGPPYGALHTTPPKDFHTL